ncbi:MAG: hypothetical protein KGJ34_00165 [Patescibacteria group bacterium]|nr:hypothetical protein [Patescibacteria group bacterium]
MRFKKPPATLAERTVSGSYEVAWGVVDSADMRWAPFLLRLRNRVQDDWEVPKNANTVLDVSADLYALGVIPKGVKIPTSPSELQELLNSMGSTQASEPVS